jgi:Ca-activated chloride channel homolog
MKAQYEAERPRLTHEQRQTVWDRILASAESPGRGARGKFVIWAAVGGAIAVTGLIVVSLLREVPPRPATDLAQQAASSGARPTTPPNLSTHDSLAHSSTSPEPAVTAGQDRPVAARIPATPPRGAAGSGKVTGPAPPTPKKEQTGRDDVLAGMRQTGTIGGSVKDANGKPLPYANVLILGTAWGAMSDNNGFFSIRNVPTGTYSVKAQHMGYTDQEVDSVEVLPDLAANLDLELKQKVVGVMNLVEITAARERIKANARTSLEVRGNNPESMPVDEITELIGLKAGVVAQGGELHSRGGRGGEVQFKPDGTPVPDAFVGGNRTAKIRGSAAPPTLSMPTQPPVVPITGGSTLPNDEAYDSMYFEHYGVNPFIATEEDSLSTFAADVDAASYTVTRRYIELGHLPPKDAVRVEEFINFFKQDYQEFHEPDFRILIDGAPSAFGSGYHLLRIGLKGRVVDTEHRRPANLTFVIDVSGSMGREDRLELVKKALEILVGKLRPNDRVGLVIYGTNAQVLLEPTSIRGKDLLLTAIHGLRPSGSTNAEAGLLLGYDMARRNYDQKKINRIILCADGVANEGVTGAEAILDRVRRESDRGIALSTIGFGMGNYNDVLMEKLADKGDGNYYYVDRLDEASRVFSENLTGTLETIARDVKIQVAFDPCRIARYRLLGFENRDVADRDFRNDRVDAGEIGAGHEMTALYEVKLTDGVRTGRIATVRLRYARPEGDSVGPPEVRELEGVFDAGELAQSFDEAQPRFRLDAAAAEMAEILRHSFWAKESRIVDVLSVVQRVAGELSGDPDVRDFATMVEKATRLSETVSPEERKTTTPGASPE